jgi:hypothetical protein
MVKLLRSGLRAPRRACVRRYVHAALAALPSRTVGDLALPWRRDAPPLARIDGAWVYLEPEVLYRARWIQGAKESSRRQARRNHHVSAGAMHWD